MWEATDVRYCSTFKVEHWKEFLEKIRRFHVLSRQKFHLMWWQVHSVPMTTFSQAKCACDWSLWLICQIECLTGFSGADFCIRLLRSSSSYLYDEYQVILFIFLPLIFYLCPGINCNIIGREKRGLVLLDALNDHFVLFAAFFLLPAQTTERSLLPSRQLSICFGCSGVWSQISGAQSSIGFVLCYRDWSKPKFIHSA